MADISVLIEAGKATAAAPLGPALGPLGVNIGEIVEQINKKTASYSGMKVPVKIHVDSASKDFEISVGSPPTSALLKKELGLQKATDNPKQNFVGNMTMDQVKKVAEMKIDNLTSYRLKSAMREIIGSCNSLGIKIDGKPAKQVQREIRHGEYAAYFEAIGEKGTEELSEEDAKKDAIEVEDERSRKEQEKYLEEHPELKKEMEEAEKVAEEKKEAEEVAAKEANAESGKEAGKEAGNKDKAAESKKEEKK